jgi:hypothetical protein
MLREASTRTAPRRTALRFDDGAPGPWQRAMLTPSGSQTWRPTLADWQWEPWPRHEERPRCRISAGMKKCAAFPGGALTDFWF